MKAAIGILPVLLALCGSAECVARDAGALWTKSSLLGVPVGAPLAEVPIRLKAGSIVEFGDGGDFTRQVCFAGESGKDHVILFYETTPMAPREGAVVGFGVDPPARHPDPSRCVPLPHALRVSLKTAGPVSVGARRKDVETMLGPPTRATADQLSYEKLGPVDKLGCQRWQGLTILIERGVVTGWQFHDITSC